jgi:rare lipoprotein A
VFNPAALGSVEVTRRSAPWGAAAYYTAGAAAALLIQGCALGSNRPWGPERVNTVSIPQERDTKSVQKKPRAVQVGKASWYGPRFHGKKTASGEPFDQYDHTAAHPSFPLGSRVRVTRLDNERSVEVEINDRGPFVDGRIIDLSRAAAQALGMTDDGVIMVRVELLGRPETPETASP